MYCDALSCCGSLIDCFTAKLFNEIGFFEQAHSFQSLTYHSFPWPLFLALKEVIQMSCNWSSDQWQPPTCKGGMLLHVGVLKVGDGASLYF